MDQRQQVQTLRKKINQDLVAYRTAKSQLASFTQDLDGAGKVLEDILLIQETVQKTAKHVQQQVHNQLCPIVSRCLAEIFPQSYEFKIEFDCKRGRTEPRLVFLRDGHEFDPVDESGGGVLEVAAFALRLAKLLLSRPKHRRLLVLDEPFRCLNEAAFTRMKELLVMLSEELKMQFIIITHEKELQVGKVIEIG